jgi:hypothetical protein
MLPVLLNVATTQGYNPLVMCMLWVFAGGGKLFVYQNTVLMMGYAYGMFTGKDLLKVGAVLTLVEGLLILLLVPLYWPLIGLSWTSTPAAQHSVQAEAVSVISPPSPGLDAETAAWARVRHATAPQDIIEFLAAFPASPFAFAARMRLRQLQQPPQLAPPAAESGAARRP